MNKFYTYLLIDPRNNRPFYVGKGTKNRMTIHERKTINGDESNNNLFLFNKIKKILELGMSIKYKKIKNNVTEDVAFYWEKRIISCLRQKGYDLCNISDGGKSSNGNSGKKWSDERKKKMSAVRKGFLSLQWFIDRHGFDIGTKLYSERIQNLRSSRINRQPCKPITEETRNKLIDSHTGKKQSSETKKKISLSMNGKNKGITRSKETRKKMSFSKKGLPSNMLGKKHSNISKEKMKNSHIKNYILVSPTGELSNINCLKDFCKKHNLNYGNMSSVATGKRKTCQGWTLP